MPHFIMPCCRWDRALAETRLFELRSLYPEDPITVLADDCPLPILPVYTQGFALEGRTKVQARGAQWLDIVLQMGERYDLPPVKIDPDTKLYAAVTFPEADFAAGFIEGTLQWCGGLWVMSPDTIRRIQESKMLLEERFRHAEFFYARFSNYLRPGERYDDTPVLHDDAVLRRVLDDLGIAVTPLNGVQVRHRPDFTPLDIRPGIWAAHPVLLEKTF